MRADRRGPPINDTERGERPDVARGTDARDRGSTGQLSREGKERGGGREAAGWATTVRVIFNPSRAHCRPCSMVRGPSPGGASCGHSGGVTEQHSCVEGRKKGGEGRE
jgi:hypothetical protein